MKTELWNEKLEEEKRCMNRCEEMKKTKEYQLKQLSEEYETKKKAIIHAYMTTVEEIQQEKQQVNVKYTENMKALQNKYEIKLNEEKGKLFEKSHLHVIGISGKNKSIRDFLSL